MHASARFALLAFAAALAVTAARPIEDMVSGGRERRGGERERRGEGDRRAANARRCDPLVPTFPPPPLPLQTQPGAPPRSTPLLRRLLQLNSTQRTGPWAPIVGTTGTAMPGYYPRLNLTRNGSTQVAATAVPDPLRVSSFPGSSEFPSAATTASGSLANGGAAITGGGIDFDPAVVGPPDRK